MYILSSFVSFTLLARACCYVPRLCTLTGQPVDHMLPLLHTVVDVHVLHVRVVGKTCMTYH